MTGMTMRRALAAFVLVGAAAGAFAQSWPTRPVKIIVPYSPGGLPDTVARVVGQALSEKWGQQVVVENKPGGNGLVAAPFITTAAPDGYTLLVTDGTMFSVNLYTYRQLPPALVRKISKDVAEVVKSHALSERMTMLGIDAVGGTLEAYAAQHAEDRERYGRAVKTAGIKPE